ncbi:MAG: hypothetical protein FK733_05890 [Asgard group archaeon]|nr:hypothetical protein [Asgard group archaeon]
MDAEHNKEVTKVLKQIIVKLSKTNIMWLLSGSTNLFIQGIKITASDIDIISTKEDLFRIEEIFKDYIVKKIEYNESEKYRSWFGRLNINSIQIDLMADLEYKPPNSDWIKSDSLNNKMKILFDNYALYVNSLESELTFYSNMKRKKDDIKKELIMRLKNSTTKTVDD